MHTHFTTWDVPAALNAAPDRDHHVWWHVHTLYKRDLLSIARNTAKFWWLGRRVEGVICPSDSTASLLRARGLRGSSIHVVPGGIDLSRFPLLAGENRTVARASLGVPREAEVLLHFGWDWEYKGGDLFLASVESLVRSGHEHVLGLTQNKGDQPKLTARRLGIEAHIRQLPHFDDVRVLFGAADVFIKASEREGVPYAVLESLASGTPVVAANIEGHPLADGAAPACTAVPHRPDAIAAAVAAHLDRGPGERAKDEAASREWIAANLTAEMVAGQMLDLFESGLSRSLRGGRGQGRLR